MDTEEESTYSRPGSQHEGYVGITDYTNSLDLEFAEADPGFPVGGDANI